MLSQRTGIYREPQKKVYVTPDSSLVSLLLGRLAPLGAKITDHWTVP